MKPTPRHLDSWFVLETAMENIGKTSSVFRPLVLVGKCICLFPFGGETQVGWFSWKLLHVHLQLTASAILFAISAIHGVAKGMAFNDIQTFLQNVTMCCSAICFTIVARKWPSLMYHWKILELPSMSQDALVQMRHQRNVFFGLYVTSAFGLVYINTYGYFSKNGGGMEKYVKRYYFYVFEYVPYNSVTAAVLFMHRLLAFATRVFTDLFIIILAASMAFQFKEFNNRFYKNQYAMQNFSMKVTQTNFLYSYCRFNWKRFREDYTKLCQLCCHVDDILSHVIIISYVLNVTNTLLSVYTIFESTMNIKLMTYFSVVSGLVIVRLVAVTLYASYINEESRRPIDLLISLPSEVYNKEIDRWLNHLSFDTANLTVKRFFIINRSVILNITAAIVTYELILFQFNPTLR